MATQTRKKRGVSPADSPLSAEEEPAKDIDMERAVLGSFMLDPGVIPLCMGMVSDEDFYLPGHRHVFNAIMELYREGIAIDLLLVCDRVRTHGNLLAAGGYTNIASMEQNVLASGAAPDLCKRIAEFSAMRRFRAFCGTAVDPEKAKKMTFEDIKEFLAVQGKDMGRISSFCEDEADAAAKQTERAMEELLTIHEAKPAVELGMACLEQFGRPERGEVMVVGARTSVGKSAFAGFVTLRNTQATGHGALILSYEMKPEKWRERFISAETGINTWMARKRGATREQRERMAQAAKAIGKLPIHVHNSVGMGVDDIQSVVRRTKIKEPGLSLVVLDYVGLVKPRQGQEPRLCMREASNTMKQLAMELDIVVFLLAQLNRESQKDKVVRAPRLIDLKDCGDLEQDADMVYLLHRDAKIKPEDTPTYPVNVEVAKNRNGLIGATTILFDSHTLRYLDPSEEREPERKAVDDRDLDY